jgi:ABC-type microcin C transport system duplicated ATPase subunit YejF
MHKYETGQTVDYSGESGSHHTAGQYEIVRLLPETASGEPQYRLRKIPDGPERIAREHLLRTSGTRTG